jgi:ABC-type Fe3+-siderophore transport system permease subunit
MKPAVLQAWLTGRAQLRRFRGLAKIERKIYYASASIPVGLLVATWKIVLVFIAPSFFLLSNVVFALGAVTAKYMAVRAHRHSNRSDTDEAAFALQIRTYRMVGAIVLGLAIAYVAFAVVELVRGDRAERYSLEIAVAIAAATFVELIISVVGFFTARREGELVVEAIRLTNLAASLVLLVLTQTALLSLTRNVNLSVYDRTFGIGAGSLAAVIGAYMLLRPLPRTVS